MSVLLMLPGSEDLFQFPISYPQDVTEVRTTEQRRQNHLQKTEQGVGAGTS